jgi:hypothetical protein
MKSDQQPWPTVFELDKGAESLLQKLHGVSELLRVFEHRHAPHHVHVLGRPWHFFSPVVVERFELVLHALVALDAARVEHTSRQLVAQHLLHPLLVVVHDRHAQQPQEVDVPDRHAHMRAKAHTRTQHANRHTRTHAHTHTHKHARMHAHTHTNTHTHKQRERERERERERKREREKERKRERKRESERKEETEWERKKKKKNKVET